MSVKRIDFGVDDLTKSALKRLVTQLLAASDGEEKKILDSLAQQQKPQKNDLADLVEEKRGKPREIDPMDEEAEDDEPEQKGMT